MTFLHGFPLALLIALPLIPLVLHLLTLQRLKTVELPTFRFLFDSYVQQRRRTQFLEVLLVLLRMLVIAGIVLFLSRPLNKSVSGLFAEGSGRDVFILIDCSASMSASAGGSTAFDRARKYAKEVLSSLAKDDRITLIRVTGKPELIFSRFASDAGGMEERINNLQLSPARANLFAALNSVFGDEKKRPANALVYFFTDCQASGWKEIGEQQAAMERMLPPGTPFILVDVSSEKERPNLAITGMPPPHQRSVVGLPLEMRARVHNYSQAAAEAKLTFSINEKVVDSIPLKLEANEEKLVELPVYVPAEEGVLRGKYTIEPKDASHDSFPDDNEWLFTIPVQSRLRVLIVNGNPTVDPSEDETLYLRAALGRSKLVQPVGEGSDLRRILDVTTEVESDFANLDENGLRNKLGRYHVVALANCGTIHGVNPLIFPALRDYVAQGGGLLLFPGDKVKPEIWNLTLFQGPPPQNEQLTTARLGAETGDLNRADTFARILNETRENFDHRVVSCFKPMTSGTKRYFDDVYIRKRFPITFVNPLNLKIILRYRDRTPALIESAYGEGIVVLASFPLNKHWTNLPLNREEFVPLMIELIRHTQKRPDAEGPSVTGADQKAEFTASNAWLPITASVNDQLGRGPFPLTFERAGPRAEAIFDQTSARGYYTVKIASGREAAKSETLAFAVNLVPEESTAQRVGEADAKAFLPSAKLTYENRTAESTQREPTDSRREYWREIIYIMLLLIGGELLLATLRGGSAKKAKET